jgi:hypothetical protein
MTLYTYLQAANNNWYTKSWSFQNLDSGGNPNPAFTCTGGDCDIGRSDSYWRNLYIRNIFLTDAGGSSSRLAIHYKFGLELMTKYTPASSSEANVNAGVITWDDNYLYVRHNSNNWKRVALSTFG